MFWILLDLLIALFALLQPVPASIPAPASIKEYQWTITFCTIGVDAGWVEGTIEDGWEIGAELDCYQPDMIVELVPHVYHPDYGEVCAITHLLTDPCLVQISNVCLASGHEYPTWVVAHEFGHCAGLGHRETGVMAQPPTSMPTEEDKSLMRERFSP